MSIQERTDSAKITGVRTATWAEKLEAYGWKQPIGSALRQQYEERQIHVTSKVFFAEDPQAAEGDRIVDSSNKKYLVHGVVEQAGLAKVWRVDVEEVK